MNRGAFTGAVITSSQPVTLRLDAEDNDTDPAGDWGI